MNFLKILPLFLSVFIFLSCEKEPEPVASAISVTTSIDTDAGVCVGQAVNFSVRLTTDPTIGIAEFSISKNGTVLQQNTSITANNLTIDYSFTPNSDDLAKGNVEFVFAGKDKNSKTLTETVSFDIITEYSFRVEDMTLSPAWDLVKNESVSDTASVEADLFMQVESRPCGPFCVNVRLTLKSDNGTEFIQIPFDEKVNYFSNETKTEAIQNLISGISPVTELVLYSEFDEDATSSGNLLNTPLVFKIRGKETYAVFDYVPEPSAIGNFLYKKTSEFAGE